MTIDDKLLSDAKRFSGIEETSEVVRHALRKFVQREAAQRLARLGGSDPNAWVPDRHRRMREIDEMHEERSQSEAKKPPREKPPREKPPREKPPIEKPPIEKPVIEESGEN